jgi:hypothetical protein
LSPKKQKSGLTRRAPTWGSASEYLTLARWLVPNVVRHARARLLAIMLLSVFSVAARGATAGSVLLYARARSNGDTIELLGQQLPSDGSVIAFAVWGGAALLFSLLDVGLRSIGDRINFDIAETYANTAMQDLLAHAAYCGELKLPDDLMIGTRVPLVATLQIDTQRMVRVLAQGLSSPTHLITFIVVFGVLASINAVLTTVLIPLLAAYSLGIAAVNRRMLRDSQRRQSAMPEVRKDLQGVSLTLARIRYPDGAKPAWLTSFPKRTWMERSVGAYKGMWFARRRVQYLRDGFNGIALLLIVMVFGTLLASETTPWASLITYLVALAYGIQSMDKFSRLVTVVNRQIPHVRRYVWFMQNHPKRSLETPPADKSARLRVSIDEDALPDSSPALDLAIGSHVFCLYSHKITNVTIGDITLALTGGDAKRADMLNSELFALTRIALIPERSLLQFLPHGADTPDTRNTISTLLEEFGVQAEFEKEIGGLDKVITTDCERLLSTELRFVLRLVPGLVSGTALVALGWDILANVKAPIRERILRALDDRTVLLFPNDPSTALPDAPAQVMVIGDTKVIGIGDRSWHEMLRREGLVETPQWIIEERSASAAAQDDDDLDDDDDDE